MQITQNQIETFEEIILRQQKRLEELYKKYFDLHEKW